MKTKSLFVVNAVLSAAAAAAVNTVLHPCHGEMAMKCNHTTQVGTVLLVILLVLNIAALIIRKANAQKALASLSVLASAAVFFVPALGSCGSAMMACNAHTMPAFRIAGAVLFVIAAVSLAAGFIRKPQASAA